MSEFENFALNRRIEELAENCRIDREDAWFIAEVAQIEGGSGEDRGRVEDLLRRCAATIEPEAFVALKRALTGKFGERTERVLLKTGANGPEVGRLRSALGAAAKLVGDRRMDPGAGLRFDAACASALRAFQSHFEQPVTGVLDSGTVLTINYVLQETDEPLLDLERFPPSPKGISLHFYPGDGAQKLVVKQGKLVLDIYDMRGGPQEVRPDDRPGVDNRFQWAPTPKGTYRLAGSARHVTAAWKYSQIPWDAGIRERDGEVQFQTREGGPWFYATGAKSVFQDRPEEMQFVRRDFIADGRANGRVVERYRENDFGHRAIYLERNGQKVGHMLHATPREERRYADDEIPLTESHGCEHMRPADIDEALGKGYFQSGTPFVVHGYNEIP